VARRAAARWQDPASRADELRCRTRDCNPRRGRADRGAPGSGLRVGPAGLRTDARTLRRSWSAVALLRVTRGRVSLGALAGPRGAERAPREPVACEVPVDHRGVGRLGSFPVAARNARAHCPAPRRRHRHGGRAERPRRAAGGWGHRGRAKHGSPGGLAGNRDLPVGRRRQGRHRGPPGRSTRSRRRRLRPGAREARSPRRHHAPRRHLPRRGKVPDPYRWLEDDTSAETAAWVEAQNKVTFAYLEKIPFRARSSPCSSALRLREVLGAVRKGEYFFFSKNDGLQNQSVLYIQRGLDGTPEVLIDPNAWSEDGTVRLATFAPSKDAKLRRLRHLAQRLRLAGIQGDGPGDEADAGRQDRVGQGVGAAWHGDGFYYSRYPRREGPRAVVGNENHQVYYHRIGTPQSEPTSWSTRTPANPQRFHMVRTTEDERFAILTVSDRGKGKKATRSSSATSRSPGSRSSRRSSRDRRRHLRRRRQRGRQAAGRTDNKARPTAASSCIDPKAPARGELDDGARRRRPSRCRGRRRPAASCSRRT
jgi:hypothetical protein